MISRTDPTERRQAERQLVSQYRAELVAQWGENNEEKEKPALMDEVLCWEEYIQGGAGKWAWFLCLMLPSMPLKQATFFHDQVAAFLRDHFPDPTKMVQPRCW